MVSPITPNLVPTKIASSADTTPSGAHVPSLSSGTAAAAVLSKRHPASESAEGSSAQKRLRSKSPSPSKAPDQGTGEPYSPRDEQIAQACRAGDPRRVAQDYAMSLGAVLSASSRFERAQCVELHRNIAALGNMTPDHAGMARALKPLVPSGMTGEATVSALLIEAGRPRQRDLTDDEIRDVTAAAADPSSDLGAIASARGLSEREVRLILENAPPVPIPAPGPMALPPRTPVTHELVLPRYKQKAKPLPHNESGPVTQPREGRTWNPEEDELAEAALASFLDHSEQPGAHFFHQKCDLASLPEVQDFLGGKTTETREALLYALRSGQLVERRRQLTPRDRRPAQKAALDRQRVDEAVDPSSFQAASPREAILQKESLRLFLDELMIWTFDRNQARSFSHVLNAQSVYRGLDHLKDFVESLSENDPIRTFGSKAREVLFGVPKESEPAAFALTRGWQTWQSDTNKRTRKASEAQATSIFNVLVNLKPFQLSRESLEAIARNPTEVSNLAQSLKIKESGLTSVLGSVLVYLRAKPLEAPAAPSAERETRPS